MRFGTAAATATYQYTAAADAADSVTATLSWRPAGQIPTSLSADDTPNWRITYGHAKI